MPRILAHWKNIALIGMRCTGKTGIAQYLSEKIGMPCYDIDKIIAQKTGKSIADLTNNGENWAHFRQMETEILQELLQEENIIISCGGGCGVNDVKINDTTYGKMQFDLLNTSKNTFKILLESSVEKIISRLKNDVNSKQNRPKLTNHNSVEEEVILQNHYRQAGYRKLANIAVNTSDAERNFGQISRNIIQKIHKKTNAVIGFPVLQSLSPDVHNYLYQAMNLDDQYEFIHLEISPQNLHKIRNYILENNLYGISVTTPHKVEIMQYLDVIDDSAREIGAVNTIIRGEKNELIGYNTDYIGIVKSLENIENLPEKRIAILGCGGAGMAAIYGLKKICKNITILNRDMEKCTEIARKFGCECGNISNFNPDIFDIIINCTSCGHNIHECPVNTAKITSQHTVFDIIYHPLETKLLKESRENGAKIIIGTEMLINQMVQQYELYTNITPNIEDMRSIVEGKIQQNLQLEKLKSRIFISIFGTSISEIRDKILQAKKHTKNIEIRIDSLVNLEMDSINKIANIAEGMNVILTCRKLEHGGNYTGKNYNEIMKKASHLFDFIDIDHLDWEIAKILRENKAKIILSYHNFHETPAPEMLRKIIENMRNYADFCKIATRVNSEAENAILASMLSLEGNIIAIGMGNLGRILRVSNILFDSKITFATLSRAEITAPGQLSFEEMVNFYRILLNN